MIKDFNGRADRLADLDLPLLGHRIGVGEDEVHALIEVEARGSGFDRHGRPAMLFEPHLFYKHLGEGPDRDKAVKLGLARKNWVTGQYPKDSYPTLMRAQEIDPVAALKSASWGMGQILGENHEAAGFRNVRDMVLSFMDSEANQLEAMIRFILNAGIADALRRHQWEVVARVYNGPSYAVHGYHTRLAKAYAKWSKIKDTDWKPDQSDAAPITGSELVSVQKKLRALGYTEVGTPDGKWGTKTRAAVLGFRADHGLPIYVGIDDQFLAALLKAEPRVVAPERQNTTAEDLRKGGSKIIASTDKANGAAVAAGGAGVIGVGLQAMDAIGGHLDTTKGLLDRLQPVQDAMISAGPWIMLALAVYVIFQMYKAQRARVDDHRTGKNSGPDHHKTIEVER